MIWILVYLVLAFATSCILKYTKIGDFCREGSAEEDGYNVLAVFASLGWPVTFAILLLGRITTWLGVWGTWVVNGRPSKSTIDLDKQD